MLALRYPIGSMYTLYGIIYHQYTPVMLAYIYQHHGSVMGTERIPSWDFPGSLGRTQHVRCVVSCLLDSILSGGHGWVTWPRATTLFPVWRFPEMGGALNHPLMVFNRLFHEINQACLDIFGYPPLMERWNPYIMMNGLVFLGYLFHQKPQICQKRNNSMEIPV